ncbi:MAG: hypothetical protein RIF34_08460, partial [Candidatus Kapaibacterium sp.]
MLIQNLGDAGIKTRVEKVIVASENPVDVNGDLDAREFFRIGGMNIVDYLNSNNVKGKILDAGEKIEEEVEYLPKIKGNHSIIIRLVFDEEVNQDTAIVTFLGTGLVPNLSVTNVTYATPMLINDEASFQTGEAMVITNEQVDEFGFKLNITDVTYANNADVSTIAGDFQGRTFNLDQALIDNLKAAPIEVGESVTIPVDFVARDINNQVTATITSNADDTAPTFNNKSEWTGIGYNAGLVVSDDESEICIGATDQLSL